MPWGALTSPYRGGGSGVAPWGRREEGRAFLTSMLEPERTGLGDRPEVGFWRRRKEADRDSALRAGGPGQGSAG